MFKVLVALAAISLFGMSWSGAWLVMDAMAKDSSTHVKSTEQCHQQMTTVPYPAPYYLKREQAI